MAKQAPNVLQFEAELVLDGRTLPRPVNYVAGADHPAARRRDRPAQAAVRRRRSARRPRAGDRRLQGRQRDRRGDARRPSLLLRRLPARAGARPDDRGRHARPRPRSSSGSIELHPEAEGKPVRDRQLPGRLGGDDGGRDPARSCSARSSSPGAPLSYWAGVRGKNPMRYTGGLLGGSWLTALAGDSAHGKFDGAWLVQNFENMNPSNTSGPSSTTSTPRSTPRPPRYLGFEKWWGGHVTAQRRGDAVDRRQPVRRQQAGHGRDRHRATACAIDLRNITLADHRASARRATTSRRRSRRWAGSSTSTTASTTSAPTARPSSTASTTAIGHLGIFVSGGVAQEGARRVRQQHRLDRRACRPASTRRCCRKRRARRRRPRRRRVGDALRGAHLRDLAAHGGNGPRTSAASPPRGCRDQPRALPEFAQPGCAPWSRRRWRRRGANAPAAALLRDVRRRNPWMAWVGWRPRGPRRPPAGRARQSCQVGGTAVSKPVSGAERQWPQRERSAKRIFQEIYGSPAFQALSGVAPKSVPPRPRPREMPEHRGSSWPSRTCRERWPRGVAGGPYTCADLGPCRSAHGDERAFAVFAGSGSPMGPEKLRCRSSR